SCVLSLNFEAILPVVLADAAVAIDLPYARLRVRVAALDVVVVEVLLGDVAALGALHGLRQSEHALQVYVASHLAFLHLSSCRTRLPVRFEVVVVVGDADVAEGLRFGSVRIPALLPSVPERLLEVAQERVGADV